ncbi:MAG: ABC transporter permease, partial [Planctomycetota bacterium]|nr:ABC transporter permease [Planctomycetota bacterium]
MLALAMKDLRLLANDKAGFFFTFFFPLLMAVFFGTVFAGGGSDGGGEIAIVAVDEDQSELSRSYLQALDDKAALQVEVIESADQARDLVRRGRRAAFIRLPAGFGDGISNPFFQGATIELGVDPARTAEAGMIEGLLMEQSFQQLQGIFTSPDLLRSNASEGLQSLQANQEMPAGVRSPLQSIFGTLNDLAGGIEAAEADGEGDGADAAGFGGLQPVTIEKVDVARQGPGPANAYAVTFPQGIMWGMIGACAAFAISLVVERNRGTLVRLRMSPLSDARILAGKALACFATTLAVSIVLLLIARFVFGVRPDSIPLLALA